MSVIDVQVEEISHSNSLTAAELAAVRRDIVATIGELGGYALADPEAYERYRSGFRGTLWLGEASISGSSDPAEETQARAGRYGEIFGAFARDEPGRGPLIEDPSFLRGARYAVMAIENAVAFTRQHEEETGGTLLVVEELVTAAI